ncbi:energy transducer TonB [Acidicapsa acidisoli]|uniref:energy transducer TonB n=1 Tax=Acidicapsa acidisoli TaxID=1615681 RepID=UPI0021DFF249|nr:energy transducer TonB [Acidicapsa acidisoli]
MKWHDLQNSCKGQRRIAAAIMRLAVFAAAMAIAMPLHAADERAIKQRVSPTYPELARRMRISGVVRVSATVSPDGSVSATKTVSGNHMLAGAAEDAVHKWKFVPASDQSTVEVDVNFALAQ